MPMHDCAIVSDDLMARLYGSMAREREEKRLDGGSGGFRIV